MRGERGFALVITLIITALLVALVVEFMDDVFVETSSRQNFVDAQQASLMANSGIEGAKRILQFSQLEHPSYTTLADKWAKPMQVEDEKGSLTVTIEDESGKLNLNEIANESGRKEKTFFYEAVVRLFKNEGISLDLIDALADWRDNNEEALPGGAESIYYMTMKPPYKAKNSALQTLEELALIKGFDMTVISRLRPFVTVYPIESTGAKINLNTAPQQVIAALSAEMTPDLAKRVTDYRMTTPFKNAAELANVPGLGNIAMQLQLYTDVKGSLYHVYSEARVRETSRTVEAVMDSSGNFLYWREF